MPDKSTPAPRRTRTDHPGVYKSVTGRYEITYRDSDGKQRWQTVAGGFDDAKQALRDKQTSKHKGEPVRPSRATFLDVAAGYLASSQFKRLAPTTRHTYAAALAPDKEIMRRFGAMKVAAIDTE